MIILQRLRAENFKGLRSVDLTFPERGSILIEGHNEAGKSTLFEAVYVALYGEPLVGEDTRPRLEEVIQFGQPQARVELRFMVGVEELTIERILRRGQSQRARLTIRHPDGTEEPISRVSAVNQRILDELNNLDGDNLRNSCFVEQKELGRLEDMDSGKREQAIQKLLGLERLTKLGEQFKFKRDQERELSRARRLLELAQAQADIRSAEKEARALAERMAAIQAIVLLAEHARLESEQTAAEAQLNQWEREERKLRARLTQVEQARAQLDACRGAEQQLEKAAAQRQTVEQFTDQLATLDIVDHETLPATRAQRAEVEALLALVMTAEQKREAVRTADDGVQEAQRAVETLERAEAQLVQHAEALDAARVRANQHQQDTQAARERIQQRVGALEAQRARLELARERVTAWERACGELAAAQTAVREADTQARALAEQRATLQRQEAAARQAAQVAADAERARLAAEKRRNLAEGRAALQEWMRLNEVKARLSGFVHDRARLEDEQRHAGDARAAAHARTRAPLYTAVGATALAALMLVAGAVQAWFFAVGGLLTVVAIPLWMIYMRAHAAYRARAAEFDAAESRLRDLMYQYQAAVRASGDPAQLRQRERELVAVGVAVPSSLDAARTMLADLSQQAPQDSQQAREAASTAVTNAARMAAEAEQAQAQVDQTRATLRELEASGDVNARLRALQAREAEQQAAVEAAAIAAQDAARADLPWPTSSAEAQAALAACTASHADAKRAIAEQEAAAGATEREDTAAIVQAEQARKAAEEAATKLRAHDPRAMLAAARATLVAAKSAAHEADGQAQRAAQPLRLTAERAVVDAERGRVDERIRALTQQVATRPALTSALGEARTRYTEALRAISATLATIIEAAHALAVESLPSLAMVQDTALDEHRLMNSVNKVRVALESRLAALDEPGAQGDLERLLHEKGTLAQRLRTAQNQLADAASAIREMFAARGLPSPMAYTTTELAAAWPLAGVVRAEDEDHIEAEHEQARNRLFAARDRERRLSEELEHTGEPLHIEECDRRVRELVEEQAICQRATRLIQEARERIARQVLPTTERNMQLLLPDLTARRYWDVRLTPPEGDDGQISQLDYRIRVWDQAAGRYVAKRLFSGGTRDQCSLALRLAFALATLPQELGVAPGFIFLDEPLSAFDAQRAQALVDLLTTGVIAQQFAQVVVISHQHAFDRHAFQYHVRMDGGQVAESDLPDVRETTMSPVSARPAAKTASTPLFRR